MKAKTSVGTLVVNNFRELKSFSSHVELKSWADRHQINTAVLFSQFKRRLFDIGVDYDALKYRNYNLGYMPDSITHSISLYSFSNFTNEKFGITNHLGEPLWYGRFFNQDNVNSLQEADLTAAKKALWFASNVRASKNLKNILQVNLYVSAQWLTFQMHDQQKSFILSHLANKYKLYLNIIYVEKESNLAHKWANTPGFKRWSENNLFDLAESVLQNITA